MPQTNIFSDLFCMTFAKSVKFNNIMIFENSSSVNRHWKYQLLNEMPNVDKS